MVTIEETCTTANSDYSDSHRVYTIQPSLKILYCDGQKHRQRKKLLVADTSSGQIRHQKARKKKQKQKGDNGSQGQQPLSGHTFSDGSSYLVIKAI